MTLNEFKLLVSIKRSIECGVDCYMNNSINQTKESIDKHFQGLSPAQEYDQHIKKRKEALEKYGEIE